jgi:tRNA nucleotidyltransferase (CCA-adding enzyme)
MAISTENFGKFILAARAYLKKPSLEFFNSKKLMPNIKNLKNIIIVRFNYKSRSPDIIWGQVKRGANALSVQLELAGFQVLRKSATTDEISEAAMLFLLHSSEIEKIVIKNGPDVFRKSESENFIRQNSKNKLIWVNDDGRILSLQEREFYEAKKFLVSLLKKNLSKAGIPRGIIPDMKNGFMVLEGHPVVSKSIKKALSELTSTDELIFGSNK